MFQRRNSEKLLLKLITQAFEYKGKFPFPTLYPCRMPVGFLIERLNQEDRKILQNLNSDFTSKMRLSKYERLLCT